MVEEGGMVTRPELYSCIQSAKMSSRGCDDVFLVMCDGKKSVNRLLTRHVRAQALTDTQSAQ